MENCPSMNTIVVSDDNSFEESGWTMYIDDFNAMNKNNNENNSSLCFDDETICSSDLISDAASLILKNSNGDIENKSVSFKKRKMKVFAIDDSLEDTASSPVNSPKVCDIMKQPFTKTSKHKEMDISQVKGNNNIASSDEVVDERSNLGFTGRESENTELKKRGFCLVPLSVVVNYFN
ncbi:vascular-related unknown protein 1-like [Mercurialis annua]|uniref:vascular-related unknown protein 1-like n=1 Tax=Mercurialis annua TaxID=3986 RepID=UPI00215E4BEA|nr:vascular-related unknown protein 1-like [Mercurialis annua]